jgi:hypothetical protein
MSRDVILIKNISVAFMLGQAGVGSGRAPGDGETVM